MNFVLVSSDGGRGFLFFIFGALKKQIAQNVRAYQADYVLLPFFAVLCARDVLFVGFPFE